MKFLLLILIFISPVAYTYFDLTTGIQGRTHPSLGGNLTLTGGFNIPIWGQLEKGDVAYGLIRLQSELATSSVVYHEDHSITFYPISFIGLGAGHKKITSEYEEFTFYDCEKVRCVGEMKKDYIFGKAILGYNIFVTSFRYEFSRNQYNDPDELSLPVAEFEHATTVASEYETNSKQIYFFGIRRDKNVLGAFATHVKYNQSGQDYFAHFLIYNMNFEKSSLVLGGGNLYSTHQRPGPTFILKYSFKFLENKALF